MDGHLWVITTYFNWCGYSTKRRNYRLFASNLKAGGVNLLTMECALDGNPFELFDPEVIHVRTSSALWQKERLLNVAISKLPSTCMYVAWLDCDLLFDVSGWETNVIRLLNQFPMIQLFETVHRQARDEPFESSHTRVDRGLVALLNGGAPVELVRELCQPGFAWASRRDTISKMGLYDAGVVGGSDRLMSLTWTQQLDEITLERVLSTKARAGFLEWKAKACDVINSAIGYLPMSIFHLWHGEQQNRLYYERHQSLKYFDFDPAKDICINQEGCWEWNTSKPELHKWVSSYFANRREDG
jgi:hypothetical protein